MEAHTFLLYSCCSAHGSVCGWRDQADPPRPAAVLLQAEGQREEPEALRPAWRARVQPGGLLLSRKSSQNMNIRSHWACNLSTACFLSGGDLCQVSASLRGSVSATGGAEFPRHCHPQGHGSGRAVGASSSSSVFLQLKHHLVEKSCWTPFSHGNKSSSFRVVRNSDVKTVDSCRFLVSPPHVKTLLLWWKHCLNHLQHKTLWISLTEKCHFRLFDCNFCDVFWN